MSIRLVYDPSMLVQREEVVPALVINPHNPPPWLQNSTAQPQIVYVQQQNFVQQQPQQYVQQIDQNQLYLQQYAYQNPQMFLQNYDQLRQIQIIPNVVQIPNQDPNEPNRMLQYVQTQPIVQNQAPVQNQIAVPAQIQTQPVQEKPEQPKPREIRPPNIQTTQEQYQTTQYVPRPNQQLRPRIARPQVPMPTQQRPIVRNVRAPRFAYRPIQPRLRYQVPNVSVQKRFIQSSTMPNVINVSNVVGTTQSPIAPMPPNRLPAANTVVTPLPTNINVVGPTPQAVGNIPTNSNTSVPALPTNVALPPSSNVIGQVPNLNVVGSIPNVVGSMPNVVGSIPSTNVVNIPTNVNVVPPTVTSASIAPLPSMPSIVPLPVLNSTTIVPIPAPVENKVSRKRKSESPDEIQNKLNVLAINNNPVAIPVNKELKTEIKSENSVSTQVQKEDLLTNSTHGLVNQINFAQNQLKEKLVRNTVFTQARGRILNVKNEVKIETTSMEVQTEETKIKEELKVESKSDIDVTNVDRTKENDCDNEKNIRKVNRGINKSDVNDEMKLTEKDFVLTHVLDGFVIQESNIAFPIRKPTIERTIRLSSEAVDLNPLDSEKDLEDEIPSVAIVVKERLSRNNVKHNENPKETLSEAPKVKELKVKDKDETVNKKALPALKQIKDKHKEDEKSKKMSTESTDANLKQKSGYKKTLPELKEIKDKHKDEIPSKTLEVIKDENDKNNDKAIKETLPKDSIENKVEEIKTKDVIDSTSNEKKERKKKGSRKKDSSKGEKKEATKEDENDVIKTANKENPFNGLRVSVIKSWTMEQITQHLSDFGWKETSSVFFEHEIDGESLLLVSKSQLLTIGVKEEHADIIMEVIGS